MTAAILVVMPRLSDSMEEGTVTRWLKEDREFVQAGDDLVEIETDKATMTYQAEAAGVMHRLVQEGETVALGAPLAELRPEGGERDAHDDDVKVTTARASQHAAAGSKPQTTPVPEPARGHDRPPVRDRISASPVARRIAEGGGIQLAQLVPGSGPRGRIVKRDVESALRAESQAAATPAIVPDTVSSAGQASSLAKGVVEIEEMTRLRMIVARRMAESRATVPDFSVEVDVDAEALVALRATLRERLPDGPLPSFNDFLVKACAVALGSHPRANGAYRDGRLEHYGRVNIGVAVAAGDVLVVPVVADADTKSIGAIAAETRKLAERARSGALTPPELSGGTFTVSNLGMYGITRFTAVVNPPQAGILAVGALERRPVVRDGEVRVGQVMTLTLCADHRVLFGTDAAALLADIRAALEEPLRLLV